MEPKARRFSQIHLSTASILMMLAGVFLGGNLVARGPLMVQISDDVEEYYYGPYRGWPLPYMRIPGPTSKNVIRYHDANFNFSHFAISGTGERVELEPPRLSLKAYYLSDPNYSALAINIFSCSCALLVVTVMLEHIIRRREKHTV
jgi:hypothetical protein